MTQETATRRFEGQSVLVTGGANGLGLATAQRFAAEGARVWVADMDPETPAKGAAFGGAGVIIDVSEPGAIDRLVDVIVGKTGRLDVAVAAAGIAGGAPVAELEDDLYRTIMSTNLDGVLRTCRAAARVMLLRRQGSIITVSSVFGREGPAGTAAYAASKAGVIGLTQSLARELAPDGIRVNCIAPGHMMTDLYANAVARRAARAGIPIEEQFDKERARVPMGKFGTGEHVAGLSAFLASPDAEYITGQTINVDGGLQSR
jgi:meso-butanediol dehydrogenase/(S,S)-butanediol dehydrogenase/diacetyl reductase